MKRSIRMQTVLIYSLLLFFSVAVSAQHSDILPNNTPEWFRKIQTELDKRTDSVNLNGNTFKLLINGVESWPCREKNVEDADAIFMKTCFFHNFRSFQRKGFIRMVLDPLGQTPGKFVLGFFTWGASFGVM